MIIIKQNFNILIILLLCYSLCAQEQIENQKIYLINNVGITEYKIDNTSIWNTVDKKTQLQTGYFLKTGKNSKIEIGLEPAIIGVISENSQIILKKLLLNISKNAARCHIYLQNGALWIEMPTYLTYNLFFTIETDIVNIYLRNAVLKISTTSNSTTIEIFRGALKVRVKKSGKDEMVLAGKRIDIKSNNDSVIISDLNVKQEKIQDIEQSTLSIAMLSVYSPTIRKDNLEPVSDYVAQEIESQSNTKVLFLEDVRSILKAEGVTSLLDCMDDSCISRIGAILGVDMIVIGKVGQLGKQFVFNLKMIDALRDVTVKRVSVTVNDDIGNILKKIPAMVTQLVDVKNRVEEKIKIVTTEKNKSNDIIDTTAPSSYHNMIWVFPGTFSMGSKLNEGDDDELPLHDITIDGFFIDRYEVNRDDFFKVMGYNPSSTKGCDACPVDNVSWKEAQEYCEKTGKRLPSEAEWEYVCKAGKNTLFNYGNSISSDQANFDGRKPYGGAIQSIVRNKTMPVGSFSPNTWQVYDMHGNIAEWCSDWYESKYYEKSPSNNPKGPENGTFKVVRGGSWQSDGSILRCGNRTSYNPSLKMNTIGFRCVKDYNK